MALPISISAGARSIGGSRIHSILMCDIAHVAKHEVLHDGILLEHAHGMRFHNSPGCQHKYLKDDAFHVSKANKETGFGVQLELVYKTLWLCHVHVGSSPKQERRAQQQLAM